MSQGGISNRSVVLYHANCSDGFGAAWAAWKSLGDEAEYIPVQYNEPPPLNRIPDGSRVYIVDFSYDRETLISLARRSNLVLVRDHHKTAREALEGLTFPGLDVLFDQGKSGAVLAWEYFHPGEDVPTLLRYVQDRDLWQWKLTASRPFSAALAVEPRDFRSWDLIDRFTRNLNDPGAVEKLDVFVSRGAAILAAQRHHVESLASHAFWLKISGHFVPVVNSPVWQSELGERLCELHPESPFAAVFFVTETSVVWSLRSRGGFDVSEVARSLKGGGHTAADGFTRRLSQDIFDFPVA